MQTTRHRSPCQNIRRFIVGVAPKGKSFFLNLLRNTRRIVDKSRQLTLNRCSALYFGHISYLRAFAFIKRAILA